MIHKAWSLALGNSDDFRATADLLDKIDGTIAETYTAAATKRGIEPGAFADLMAAETWFTGQEAIDAGLADEIATDTVKAQAKWDLSAYDNPPQDAVEVTVTVAPDETVTISVEVETAAEEAAEPDTANNEIERRHRIAALRLRPPA